MDIVGLTSYVQLVGGIVLIIAIGAIYCVHGRTATRAKLANGNSSQEYINKKTSNGLNSEHVAEEKYVLRPRLILWFRQISLSVVLATNLFVLVHNHDIATDVQLEQEVGGATSFDASAVYFASHAVFLVSLACLLIADDLSNLGNASVLQAWMPIYVILFVYTTAVFFCTGTASSLLQMVFSVLTLAFASVCAYVDLGVPQVNPPTAEYTCGLLTALSFSHLNANLILPGMKKASLEFEDVPKLGDADSLHEVWKKFRVILISRRDLNLWYSLYQLVKWEWFAQGCFQFLGSTATYVTPLALERILLHIANHGRDDDSVEALIPISVELAVVLLFVGPLLCCIGDGQNYVRGRHIGIRVKGALIAAIYNKALSVDLSASKESVGKLNNMISVDVTDVQVFCCYSHLVWSTLMEILISSSLLYVVLGRAAFGGLVVMIISLAVGLAVSKLVERFQGQLLKCKDARMSIVNEVLNSMRVIKYYAWEKKFMHRINAARRAEVGKLRLFTVTNATLYTFWEVVPALVGATAFVLHTYILGQTLTPATGFTALTLFNLLRFPLDCFPEMLNYLVRTKVSIRRIESFLRTPDVKGITDACNLHGEVGGTGSAEAGRGRKKYADHEFAPHAYEEFHPAPVASSPSRAVRSPLIPGNGTRGEASAAEQPLPATGTVVLRDLKLGWSPTLREEGEDSDKQRKTSMPSVKELCFCMSRAQRVPAVAATKSQPRDGKSRNGKPATAGQNSKYQLLNGADDENSSETSTASGGFSLLNPAKINAPMSEEFYTDDDNNASHESDMENRRADGHHSPRSPRSPKTNAPNGRSPRSSTPSSAHSNGDNETSDAVAPTIILDQTSFTIPRGALAVVVGVTGSGKSSLLQGALLGEGLHLSGIAAVGGRISYASQSAWIQNATLRDNVLFGTPYDKERYDKVVFSCALLSDFKLLPAGDMTEIGEKGVNLSGGQQQRVSLARAAYAYSDVILLDDPLSAVDTLVGEHIFKELVLGFLKDRTRLLVTHNMSLSVAAADYVVCLDASNEDDVPSEHSGKGGNARSRVLTCCPPTELPRILQQLKPSTLSALASPSSTAGAGSNNDLSVFLEGLIAAAALDPTNPQSASPRSPRPGSTRPVTVPVASRSSSAAAVEPDSVPAHPASDAYLSLDAENGTPPASPVKFSLPQNNSYASLTQGVTIGPPLSPAKLPAPQKPVPDVEAAISLTDGDNASSKEVTGIVDKEGKSVGRVGWEIYWFYFKACGGIRAVVGIVGGTALCSLAWLFQNVNLGEWMYAMENEGAKQSKVQFRMYALGVLLVLLATILRAVTQVTSNLTSANALHARLISSVMSAPCSWFDATPVGRIVNRFSQDISTVDSSIMNNMYGFVDRLLATLQIVGVICVSLPLLMLPLLPVVALTWWVSKQYLHISRELKRLESLKKSPVFVLFSETLQGLAIVRAFRAEGRFFHTCCERIDEMNRCHIYLWISNRWLSFRMQVLGATVAGLVGLAVVLEAGSIGGTVAGVVLIYSLSFTEALTFLARAHADCQMDLNSIERLQEYSTLPAEKGVTGENEEAVGGADTGSHPAGSVELTSMRRSTTGAFRSALEGSDGDSSDSSLDSSQHPLMDVQSALHGSGGDGSWPSEGRVEFKNIFLKYNSCATPVLRDVSFTIAGKTKLGVVGRTGAGKSSLIAALFRLVEPTCGELLVDDVNVLNLPLHELRNNIAIVPQEPTLFRGSVRFNLDPFDQHTDEELWAALTSAHLAEHVRSMPSDPDPSAAGRGYADDIRSPCRDHSSNGTENGGSRDGSLLSEKMVAEKGANFSLGQRQLLCMARAILRKASVLVLDECTASVDHETDALIQETVRKELGNCTVICIAHRLHTIAYYDNVLVMDAGRVAECAEPFTLINTPDSIFRQMCLTSGDYEELYQSAKEAYEQRAAAREMAANKI